MKEPFEMTVSYTKRGTPWEKTLLKTIPFEAEPEVALKEATRLMMQEDSLAYSDGLYFRVVNIHKEVESFLSINTYDRATGEKSFYLRSATSGNGFSDNYIDLSEKKVYLVALDEETNDYKSYVMYQEQNNSKFGAQYGRIGGGSFSIANYNPDKDGKHFYPAKMFWVKYEEKMAKGYIDKSDEISIAFSRDSRNPVNSKNSEKMHVLDEYKPIPDKDIKDVFEFLIMNQRKFVEDNYHYEASGTLTTSFNKNAIDKAEALLNQLSSLAEFAKDSAVAEEPFFKAYKQLLLTIPRKIKDVKEYISKVSFDPENCNVDDILENERNLLDALKDVYEADHSPAASKPQKEAKPEPKQTVLEKFGLSARTADFKEKFAVLENMDNQAYRKSAHKVSKVICVDNAKTSKRYDTYVESAKISKSRRFLMWHGSRTENWWSIFKNGMSLNPDAVITGKMFGQGLYFAPLADKSLGYTDYQGSRWAHGTSSKGYLALFEVAMGKSYEPSRSLGSRFSIHDLKDGCQSVWAKASKTGLLQDECIVYREEQATIRYLVEVDSGRNLEYRFDVKDLKNLQFSDLRFDGEALSAKIEGIDSLLHGNYGNLRAELSKISESEFSFFITAVDTSGNPIKQNGHKMEVDLNRPESELLGEVFMSKIAKNEKEFAKAFDKIIEKGKIPKSISRKINDEKGIQEER